MMYRERCDVSSHCGGCTATRPFHDQRPAGGSISPRFQPKAPSNWERDRTTTSSLKGKKEGTNEHRRNLRVKSIPLLAPCRHCTWSSSLRVASAADIVADGAPQNDARRDGGVAAHGVRRSLGREVESGRRRVPQERLGRPCTTK